MQNGQGMLHVRASVLRLHVRPEYAGNYSEGGYVPVVAVALNKDERRGTLQVTIEHHRLKLGQVVVPIAAFRESRAEIQRIMSDESGETQPVSFGMRTSPQLRGVQ